jgi:hypothetical protein
MQQHERVEDAHGRHVPLPPARHAGRVPFHTSSSDSAWGAHAPRPTFQGRPCTLGGRLEAGLPMHKPHFTSRSSSRKARHGGRATGVRGVHFLVHFVCGAIAGRAAPPKRSAAKPEPFRRGAAPRPHPHRAALSAVVSRVSRSLPRSAAAIAPAAGGRAGWAHSSITGLRLGVQLGSGATGDRTCSSALCAGAEPTEAGVTLTVGTRE